VVLVQRALHPNRAGRREVLLLRPKHAAVDRALDRHRLDVEVRRTHLVRDQLALERHHPRVEPLLELAESAGTFLPPHPVILHELTDRYQRSLCAADLLQNLGRPPDQPRSCLHVA
jgi:hypothetical protein